ncbi:MAG: hypothetical protein IJU19_02310 [Bacteroidales bacterium]|nr:hypothetical protein [Bacteroidales bacterium]
MNTRKMLCTLASAMMLLVGCNKEEETTEIAPTIDTTPAAENTFYYAGKSYAVAATTVDYCHSELTVVSAQSADTMADGSPLIALNRFYIRPEHWGRTVNMASPAVGDSWKLDMTLQGVAVRGFGQNDGGRLYFSTDVDTMHSETPVFKSGTLKVVGENDGTPINILVNAVLTNDLVVKMNIKTESYAIAGSQR